MYVYHKHAWCLQRPGGAPDTLELELQMDVSFYVGAGN